MSRQLRLKRLFEFAFWGLAMLAVALVSAFITMRLAIHGREVDVPSLSGLTVPEARARARSKGLSLNVESHFYSTVIPTGRILSQLPAPNERVRRDSQIRVAESLGVQRVSIPDVIGQSERSATIALRRLSLDLGAIARISTDGPPDTIIAQTPPPNATNIDGPRVSLLVSQADDTHADDAVVMPILTGLNQYAATLKAQAAGLHIIAKPDPAAAPPATDPDATIVESATPEPAAPTGNVVSQYPVAGHRVLRGDGVHITFAQPAPDPSLSATPVPTTP